MLGLRQSPLPQGSRHGHGEQFSYIGRGWRVHCRTPNYPSLYPLDASTSLPGQLSQWKISPDCQMSTAGKTDPAENRHCLNQKPNSRNQIYRQRSPHPPWQGSEFSPDMDHAARFASFPVRTQREAGGTLVYRFQSLCLFQQLQVRNRQRIPLPQQQNNIKPDSEIFPKRAYERQQG